MSKFNFRLQKLLDIRAEKEEESKLNFKKAIDEKIIVSEKLNELNKNYDKYCNRQQGSIVERKITEKYLNALNTSINETTNLLQKKTENVDIKRNELIEKQKERKTVEILKNKQYEAFIKNENEIEQKSNDEFALFGYIRRERG